MVELPPITLRLRGRKVVGRVAFSLLLLAAIAIGGVAGLLFVYSSDLPQIRALEDFQPDVVTELYADDGQTMTSLALDVRNNGLQDLEVELPPQSQVWSAFVSGEPVRPIVRAGCRRYSACRTSSRRPPMNASRA